MKKSFAFLILFTLHASFALHAQTKTLYNDLVVSENLILGLTTNGRLNVYDVIEGKQINNNLIKDTDIILITKDKQENILIANRRKEIKRYNKAGNTWEVILKYNIEPVGILFDKKNSCFSVTERGIEDLQTGKVYYTNESYNYQIHYKEKWGNPYCYFIDKDDNIWLGFGYGEWGGNLFVFQTKNKTFIPFTMDSFDIMLDPIKSFFEDSSSVYLSTGLLHMGMKSGAILRFDKFKITTIFNSDSHWKDPDTRKDWIDGEYVGPASFNHFNNSIYFYSQNGFFRGEKAKDLSKIENWESIAHPKLLWDSGQPDAVGSPMNVQKIIIIDKTRFTFLSKKNGIGLFDGEKIIML